MIYLQNEGDIMLLNAEFGEAVADSDLIYMQNMNDVSFAQNAGQIELLDGKFDLVYMQNVSDL